MFSVVRLAYETAIMQSQALEITSMFKAETVKEICIYKLKVILMYLTR